MNLKNFVFGFLLLSQNCLAQDWTLVKELFLSSEVSGVITEGYVFKISNTEFYVIDDNKVQRIWINSPLIKIFKRDSIFKFEIEGFDEPVICKRISDIYETRINGIFKGWEGGTVFNLTNGQIWKQFSGAQLASFSFSPTVYVYKFKGAFRMKVENVDEIIQVVRVDNTDGNSPNNILTLEQNEPKDYIRFFRRFDTWYARNTSTNRAIKITVKFLNSNNPNTWTKSFELEPGGDIAIGAYTYGPASGLTNVSLVGARFL